MALGDREFTEKREAAARARFRGPRDVANFATGLLVIMLGTVMLTESIVGAMNGSTLFFEGVSRGLEFVVGLVTLIVGASLALPARGAVAAQASVKAADPR